MRYYQAIVHNDCLLLFSDHGDLMLALASDINGAPDLVFADSTIDATKGWEVIETMIERGISYSDALKCIIGAMLTNPPSAEGEG